MSHEKGYMSLWYTLGVTLLLAGATALTMFHLYRQPQEMRSDYIAQDVQELARICNRINTTCSIIGFDRVHNYIDFLQVVVFKGSEVGPMNLRYPDEWEGPYLRNNPTIQDTAYMVLATDYGHFVVPGEGVTLSNGQQIGRDIICDQHTDVSALTADGQSLHHNGKPLAVAISVDGP